MARTGAGRQVLGYAGEWLGCRYNGAPERQCQFSNVSDTVVKLVKLHQFRIGDSEDPELYAAQPLAEFMATDKGRWIKDNVHDPQFTIHHDIVTLGHEVIVSGYLSEEAETFYRLTWT